MLLPGSTRPGLLEAFGLGRCKGQAELSNPKYLQLWWPALGKRPGRYPAGLEVRFSMISTHRSDRLEDSGWIQTHLDRDEGRTYVRSEWPSMLMPTGAP